MDTDQSSIDTSIPSWSDISASDKFGALPLDQKEAVRSTYFDKYVAPSAPPEHLDAVKQAWDNQTTPPEIQKAKQAAYESQNNVVAQPETSGLASSTGKYETENVNSSLKSISDVAAPFTPDKPTDSWFKQGIQRLGQYVGGIPLGIAGLISSPAVSSAQGAVEQIAHETYNLGAPEGAGPVPQEELQRAHNIAGAEGSMGANVALSAMGGLKSAKDIRASFAPNAPPPEYSGLAEASQGTTFKKAPDVDSAGLKANTYISEAHDAATADRSAKYDTLDTHSSALQLNAPKVYSDLSSIVSELKGKVALGTDEGTALTNLEEIQNNLQDKYGTPGTPGTPAKVFNSPSGKYSVTTQQATPGTPAIPATDILASDLVDMKASANSLLKNPTKLTTAGKQKLIEFKGTIQDALDTASQTDPQFGKSLKDAEDSNNVVGQFKTDSMKNLWNNHDYMLYKAAQNDPTRAAYDADTLGRSSTFLNTLNNDTGAIAALQKTLPPDRFGEVLNDAITYSKKVTPSLERAAINFLSHPTYVVGPAGMVAKTLLNTLYSTKPSVLLDLVNRVNETNPEAAIGVKRVIGEISRASGATDTGQNTGPIPQQPSFTPPTFNKGANNAQPQSSNSPVGATNAALASSKKNDDSFQLSDLNPIGTAEAATISGATKNLPPGSQMAKNVAAIDPETKAAFEQAGAKYRVNMTEAMGLYNLESGVGGKALKNGPLQMTNDAWKQSEQLVGRSLDRNNKKDYAEASMAYYSWTRDEVQKLMHSSGKPALKDVYIAYNAGLGGFKALQQANPKAIAADVVGDTTASNNKGFYYSKDGTPLTVAQTKQMYYKTVQNKINEVSPTKNIQKTQLALNKASKPTSNNSEPDF